MNQLDESHEDVSFEYGHMDAQPNGSFFATNDYIDQWTPANQINIFESTQKLPKREPLSTTVIKLLQIYRVGQN